MPNTTNSATMAKNSKNQGTNVSVRHVVGERKSPNIEKTSPGNPIRRGTARPDISLERYFSKARAAQNKQPA